MAFRRPIPSRDFLIAGTLMPVRGEMQTPIFIFFLKSPLIVWLLNIFP